MNLVAAILLTCSLGAPDKCAESSVKISPHACRIAPVTVQGASGAYVLKIRCRSR